MIRPAPGKTGVLRVFAGNTRANAVNQLRRAKGYCRRMDSMRDMARSSCPATQDA